MAPYSFRIAHGLRTKAQVIRARLKENGRGVNMSTKSNTDSEFSHVSFGENS